MAEPEPIGMLECMRPEDDSGLRFRYTYPEQEHDIEVGSAVVDPRNRGSVTVEAIDDEQRQIVLRHVKKRAGEHPRSLVPNGIVPTRAQQESLLRIGAWAAEHGVDAEDTPFRAAREPAARAHPRVGQAAG